MTTDGVDEEEGNNQIHSQLLETWQKEKFQEKWRTIRLK